MSVSFTAYCPCEVRGDIEEKRVLRQTRHSMLSKQASSKTFKQFFIDLIPARQPLMFILQQNESQLRESKNMQRQVIEATLFLLPAFLNVLVNDNSVS